MSDTPRTDEEMTRISSQFDGAEDDIEYAMDQMGIHARELERELAQRTAEVAEAWLTNATLRADLARANAELAALKANDPLAEMWRELSEHQEQADKDGHGESWRRMCEERTGESAWEAMREARAALRAAPCDAATHAARALANATAWAVEAIAAIREDTEAKPA